jgi:hypothetical protein
MRTEEQKPVGEVSLIMHVDGVSGLDKAELGIICGVRVWDFHLF